MFIENLQISGFGCLQGEYIFSSGLNIVIAANESGKSTLADALTSLLFGIKYNTGNNRGGVNFYKKYLPLTGGEFSLSGVIKLTSGRRLNIWRDLLNDSFRVLELESGKDISSEFVKPPNSDCLGESLTGLSFMQFRKLALLNQDELNINWDFVEFVDQLAAVFTTEDSQGTTVEQAKSDLTGSLTSFAGITSKGRVKVETEISRIHSELKSIAADIAEINSGYAQAEEKFALAADQRATSSSIRKKIQEYDYYISLLRLNSLEEKLAEKKIQREKIRAIQYQIEQLKNLKDCDYADVEQLSELQALVSDKQKRIEEWNKLLGNSQEELQYLRVRVENLGKRSSVDEKLLQEIEKNIDILDNYQSREKSVLIDCRSAEAVLAEAGVRSEEVIRFNNWTLGKKKAEVALVKNYLQIQDKFSLVDNELTLQRKQHESVFETVSAERFYRFKSARNNLIFGCVFTAVSVGTFFAMGMLLFMLIPAAVCILWSLWAALRLGRVGDYRDEEVVQAQNALMQLEENFAKLEDRRAGVGDKFSISAEEMKCSVDELCEMLVRFKKAESEINNWEYVYQRHRNIVDVLEDSLQNLKDIFCVTGIADENTIIDLRRAKVLLREVSDALSIIEQHEKLENEISGCELEKEKLLAEIVELEIELKEHLNAAGIIVENEDYKEAFEEFKEKVAARKKLEQLEEKELPEITEEFALGTTQERLEAEIAVWTERKDNILTGDPWLESYIPDKDIFEYENEIKVARLQLEDTQGELSECEKVLAIEDNRKREHLPQLYDRMSELHSALEKAELFSSAIGIALNNLDEISSDLHARWSPLFSDEYNSIVSRFSDNLEFNLSKELKLTARLRESGMPLDNERLRLYMSKGMRDQIYLVLRLLLAQKVTGKECFPVILDDPFINADDSRFTQGMEYLLGLAENMQTFVFSCHKIRHDELCRYNNNFAEAEIEFTNTAKSTQ